MEACDGDRDQSFGEIRSYLYTIFESGDLTFIPLLSIPDLCNFRRRSNASSLDHTSCCQWRLVVLVEFSDGTSQN